MSLPSARRDELAARLAATHERVGTACRSAGRSAGDVRLIVVTKTWPVEDVRLLAGLGVLDVGENRDREAAAKASRCVDLRVRWHMIGRLQSNKARSVVGYARAVHSVDRTSLLDSLVSAAGGRAEPLEVFLQHSLDGDPRRGGASASDVLRLADQVAGAVGLRLRGVMAIAPLRADPDEAFARLAELSERLRREHPDAAAISAGMSADLEQAIRHGATHLRVGSAILGSRPPAG